MLVHTYSTTTLHSRFVIGLLSPTRTASLCAVRVLYAHCRMCLCIILLCHQFQGQRRVSADNVREADSATQSQVLTHTLNSIYMHE